MKKIFLLIVMSTLMTSCTKYVAYDRYIPIQIDEQYIADAKKPAKRIWTTKDKQGTDVGPYVIELNSSIDDANARFKIVRKYIEDYNNKVKELNDTAKKK